MLCLPKTFWNCSLQYCNTACISRCGAKKKRNTTVAGCGEMFYGYGSRDESNNEFLSVFLGQRGEGPQDGKTTNKMEKKVGVWVEIVAVKLSVKPRCSGRWSMWRGHGRGSCEMRKSLRASKIRRGIEIWSEHIGAVACNHVITPDLHNHNGWFLHSSFRRLKWTSYVIFALVRFALDYWQWDWNG